MIKIAGIQSEPRFMDIEGNLQQMTELLRQAKAGGAQLAIFPEAMTAGYGYDTPLEAAPYAETVPGRSVEFLAPICRQLDIAVVYGTLEKAGDRLFNTAVLIGPDGYVGSYRKVHLPYLGMDRFTNHGDRPFAVHRVGDLCVGMLICYDGAFPESVRSLALLGADLVCLPTNWPTHSECAAEHATNVRAWENNIYFAAINRVGEERGFRFIGGSRIADPSGRTLAAANADRAEILFADIDPLRARNKHLVRVPGKHYIDRIADRRPEMYGPVTAPVENPSPRR